MVFAHVLDYFWAALLATFLAMVSTFKSFFVRLANMKNADVKELTAIQSSLGASLLGVLFLLP